GAAARQRLACRIAEKAFRQGLQVYVRVDTPAEAQQFDDLLWSFAQNSFVPHALLSGKDVNDRAQPVLIGDRDGPAWIDGLLVSLTRRVPDDYRRYARIADFVAGGDDDKTDGRARFKHYRELGLEPHTHKM
ncbi:MAG: DNA polymerase III subunit chi, partial [Pseudomonadota bacterium]|nr:DNA polymerase III subunit chi [Pseudomonadota bacterium]